MKPYYRTLIAKEFRNCVEGTIHRITNRNDDYRPFHEALLSGEVLFWSSFERSFSTSFGQRVIEEVARLVALSNGATDASRQKITFIEIDSAQEDAIHDHIQDLRMGVSTSSWTEILNKIQSIKLTGLTKKMRIISDLWWQKDGFDNFISLKTVKPNIDQTAVAKEDCLHLSLGVPNCNTYFGLPYNPYGEAHEAYAFSPPMGIFDFHNDPVVLIGQEMWDTIGGAGCYDELLDIAQEVGIETRDKISNIK